MQGLGSYHCSSSSAMPYQVLTSLFAIYSAWLLLVVVRVQGNSHSYADSMFRSDGRLGQVELAIKASDRGGNVIAAKNQHFAVALSWSPTNEIDLPIEKIKRMTRSAAIVSSGIQADANYIIEKFQRESLTERYVFDREMNPSRLAKDISSFIHSRTRSIDQRPFGIRICLIAYNEAKKLPCVYEIDPYGYLHDCQALGLGSTSDRLLSLMDVDGLDQLTLSGLIKQCINALKQATSVSSNSKDIGVSIDAKDLEIVIVGENLCLSRLNEHMIESILRDEVSEDSDNRILESVTAITY
jgi:20S proteasome alpha/beta subunit